MIIAGRCRRVARSSCATSCASAISWCSPRHFGPRTGHRPGDSAQRLKRLEVRLLTRRSRAPQSTARSLCCHSVPPTSSLGSRFSSVGASLRGSGRTTCPRAYDRWSAATSAGTHRRRGLPRPRMASRVVGPHGAAHNHEHVPRPEEHEVQHHHAICNMQFISPMCRSTSISSPSPDSPLRFLMAPAKACCVAICSRTQACVAICSRTQEDLAHVRLHVCKLDASPSRRHDSRHYIQAVVYTTACGCFGGAPAARSAQGKDGDHLRMLDVCSSHVHEDARPVHSCGIEGKVVLR